MEQRSRMRSNHSLTWIATDLPDTAIVGALETPHQTSPLSALNLRCLGKDMATLFHNQKGRANNR